MRMHNGWKRDKNVGKVKKAKICEIWHKKRHILTKERKILSQKVEIMGKNKMALYEKWKTFREKLIKKKLG